jgi:2-C-methyl-D-erythritol 4-phosphate cytidylyltransferase
MERKKYVVVMAAGSGTRMGADKPKQFLELGGKYILRRTIETFVAACPDITVITVLPESYIQFWKDYCYRTGFICPQILVKGGFTRFHSVRNALSKVPDGALVAVHDGVRPLVTGDLIRRTFDRAEACGSAVPVMPCIDTMKVLQKKVWEDGNESYVTVSGEVADRSILYGAQTPQAFHSELLRAAYAQAYDTAFTDDASVVEKFGKTISYIDGEKMNFKITTQDDLVLAEAVLVVRK